MMSLNAQMIVPYLGNIDQSLKRHTHDCDFFGQWTYIPEHFEYKFQYWQFFETNPRKN